MTRAMSGTQSPTTGFRSPDDGRQTIAGLSFDNTETEARQ